MPGFRDKVNSHLPIVLQSLSTISLVVLALCALCGSQSLKKLAEAHSIDSLSHVQSASEDNHRH